MTAEHDALVEALLPAVMEAGRLQVALLDQGFTVDHKGDSSPVTEADHRSEAILLAALAVAAPGVPVVAEEEVAARRIPALGPRFFLVDPLDGTREFVARRPEFTVNVALVEHGRPVLGIILAPALGEIFATRGSGAAWMPLVRSGMRPADGLAAPLPPLGRWRGLATRAQLAGGLSLLDSRMHGARPGAQRPALLKDAVIAERRAVGSSLKFGLIARGDADLYVRLGPTSEWDTAAGQAILVAAGGAVTTLDGAPLTYGGSDPRFLNPHFIAWGRGPGGFGQ